MYAHRPYCVLLELIKITRSEPARIESLAGIEIESKHIEMSSYLTLTFTDMHRCTRTLSANIFWNKRPKILHFFDK